jgi:hypothetical protein
MSKFNFKTSISKAINPFRVFTALMVAVSFWLAFALFGSQPQKVSASPLRKDCRVCVDWNETCDNNGCRSQGCAAWVLEPCDDGSDPLPLTISGAISCTSGNNSWCVGNTQLNISATNPQGDAVIISGDVNGVAFACPSGNTSCSVPVATEGDGTVNYRANSASGGSANGTASYKLDLTTPQIDGSLNGANGANGWFVSEVDFSASASDAVSGLAALDISVNGGGWEEYAAPLTLGDGVYTVSLRAYDSAGNAAETTQTVSVDTLTPLLDISVSGAAGSNSWYVSEAEISAVASDSGSGLFALEALVDSGAWQTYVAPIILSDGVHTVHFRATDNAGNVTEAEQEVKVDTITPSLSLSVNGKKGSNGWYTSITKLSATSSDSGSGVVLLEGTADGGGWSTVSAVTFSDGLHTYQFRVTDNAGNVTIIPVQNIKIDTIPPLIEMAEELSLGETLVYELTDDGSGLAVFRTVIEDDAEKYKKISWLDSISGNKLKGDILWDGKFKDGTEAGMGEYFITLKISDMAGNEAMKSAVVSVNLLSFFQEIPAFIPPDDAVTNNDDVNEQTASEQTFGNTNSGIATEKTSSSTSTGGQVLVNETHTKVSFSQESQTANFPISTSNILWGAAATALVGATLAEWERRRKAEEARRAAAREERLTNGPGTWRQAAMAFQASLNNFRVTLAKAVSGGNISAEDAAQYLKDAKTSGNISTQLTEMNQQVNEVGLEKKAADRKALDEVARKAAELEEQREVEELQAGLMAYYLGRKAGEVVAAPQESWWDKTINWIDNHQAELSVGIGVAVGVAAIIASGGAATPLVMAAWIAGAAAVAGGTVALGTVGLNAYYGRSLGENVVRNLAIAGGTAAVLTGAGFLFQGAIQGVASYCGLNPNTCAKAEPVLNAFDTAEELFLVAKGSYQTWTGDSAGAADTAIELQMEYMDGGMPGNSISHEASEKLAKLGNDVPGLIEKYGDDIVPLLLQYGDDAVDIIGTYEDEGIALLLKFGDDAGDAIKLVKQYGTPAVKVLDAVDLASADKLLKTLDADVLDYAIKQDADAVFALSRWSEKELQEFGPELALRAEKDAKVLKAINSLIDLGPIDPKKLTDEQKALVKIIAENSMQYSDEGQIVLGKWVDYGHGFTSYARETGSVHYNPHPDMWKLFGELGDKQREETAWLVNQQVIQIGIDKGLPFEYSLNGLPLDKIDLEEYTIETIWEGGSSKEMIYTNIMESVGTDYIPIRAKELVELYSAGYTYSFDSITNSYILIKP